MAFRRSDVCTITGTLPRRNKADLPPAMLCCFVSDVVTCVCVLKLHAFGNTTATNPRLGLGLISYGFRQCKQCFNGTVMHLNHPLVNSTYAIEAGVHIHAPALSKCPRGKPLHRPRPQQDMASVMRMPGLTVSAAHQVVPHPDIPPLPRSPFLPLLPTWTTALPQAPLRVARGGRA
jgi:hypothetical protein